MVWLALAGLVAIALIAGRRRRRRPRAVGIPGVTPEDLAELNLAARGIAAEAAASSALVRHLRMIEARGVPVRRVEPTVWPERWYLGFADGTAIVIGAQSPTVIIAVRLSLTRSPPVHVTKVQPVTQGLRLELTGGRARHQVLAVADA